MLGDTNTNTHSLSISLSPLVLFVALWTRPSVPPTNLVPFGEILTMVRPLSQDSSIRKLCINGSFVSYGFSHESTTMVFEFGMQTTNITYIPGWNRIRCMIPKTICLLLVQSHYAGRRTRLTPDFDLLYREKYMSSDKICLMTSFSKGLILRTLR